MILRCLRGSRMLRSRIVLCAAVSLHSSIGSIIAGTSVIIRSGSSFRPCRLGRRSSRFPMGFKLPRSYHLHLNSMLTGKQEMRKGGLRRMLPSSHHDPTPVHCTPTERNPQHHRFDCR